MKIDIKNFGPISDLSFDLDKDLHLIYGENAIGKSYGAYCIYCLLKNFKAINYEFTNSPFHYRYRDKEHSILSFAKKVFDQLKKSQINDFLVLDNEVNKFVLDELSLAILPGIKNSFQNTFSSLSNLKNRYSDEYYKLTFHLDNKLLEIGADIDGSPIITKVNLGIFIQGILKATKTTKYSIYIDHKKRFGVANEKIFIGEFSRFVLEQIRSVVFYLNDNIRDIYFLPASRSGLYQALNAFTPIMAELTQNRFFIQNKKIELPSLPEPLSDYFIDLSTLKTSNLNKEFDAVINLLEDDILHGKVEYDDDAKKIIYSPHGLDLKLDLSEASSMVSELSPIVVFLRHIINNKFQSLDDSRFGGYQYYLYQRERERKTGKLHSILFIEEPEAHLHPEIQVKIMGVFTKLIEFGIKIIMTSHSNYMLNKLNNLILSKDISDSKIAVHHLIRGVNGCIVNEKMSISDEGIFDENFTFITRQLYDERMDILEKND